MSLSVCGQCGTRYAVGVAACPHCSSTDRATDDVGRVPVAVTVHCPTDNCDAYGKQRRIVLRQAAMGIVELPNLLCAGCGSQAAVRWPGELKKGTDMPKITVHGGSTNRPEVVGAAWGDNDDASTKPASGAFVTVGEQGLETVHLPPGVVVVATGEEDETLGGPSKPLPEAIEDDTTEHVSEPDYDTWTARQLRAVLAERKLSTSGSREVLIARLRKADGGAPDNEAGE